MFMKKKLFELGLLGLVLSFSSIGLAGSAVEICPSGACKNIDGGEIPTPFEGLNRTVELADGESYVLTGWIHHEKKPGNGAGQGRAFFEIDLEQHPWLASQRRKADPNYPLQVAGSQWRAFDGVRVRILCKAVGRIDLDRSGGAKYVLTLVPNEDI